MEKYQWYQGFAPASLILHSVKTGEQIQEPSLVAVKLNALERREHPFSDERFHASPAAIERCLAVGREALDYRDTPDVAVYSPLRRGQVADFRHTGNGPGRPKAEKRLYPAHRTPGGIEVSHHVPAHHPN